MNYHVIKNSHDSIYDESEKYIKNTIKTESNLHSRTIESLCTEGNSIAQFYKPR